MSELSRRTSMPGSLWQRNPVLFQLLGLSPLLALSTSIVLAVAISLLTAIIFLVGSALAFYARQYVEERWLFYLQLIILASLTTIMEVLLQIYWYSLYRDLGVYLPLICCNSGLLVHLQNQNNDDSFTVRIFLGAKLVAGFGLAVLTLSFLRELIGNGSVFNGWQLLIPSYSDILPNKTGGKLFDFVLLQPGAFLLLGLLIAVYNWLHKHSGGNEEIVEPAERARVTGRI